MASKPKWNKRRRAAAEAWIEQAKGPLRLQDWTLTISWAGNEDTHPQDKGFPGAFATITPAGSSKHAVVCLSRELLAVDADAQRQILTHELMHCHLFPLEEYATDAFAKAVEDEEAVVELHHLAFTQHLETATDGLADVLAPFLPAVDLA